MDRVVPAAVVARPANETQHIRELLGLPADWSWVRWSREGEYPHCWGVTIEGGIAPPKTRGKYKGQPNWAKMTMPRKYTLTDKQHDAWLAQWQRDTGFCCRCEGTGLRGVGWSRATGIRYEPCKHCDASGLAREGKRSASEPPQKDADQ